MFLMGVDTLEGNRIADFIWTFERKTGKMENSGFARKERGKINSGMMCGNFGRNRNEVRNKVQNCWHEGPQTSDSKKRNRKRGLGSRHMKDMATKRDKFRNFVSAKNFFDLLLFRGDLLTRLHRQDGEREKHSLEEIQNPTDSPLHKDRRRKMREKCVLLPLLGGSFLSSAPLVFFEIWVPNPPLFLRTATLSESPEVLWMSLIIWS